MTELTQPTQRERTAPGGGGLGSLFADNHEPAGLVTVAVGPYVERLPLGNNTVAQIRARFGLRFDIDPRSQAVLDGHEVGDDTVVRTGQVLMFVHKSGEKGAGSPRSAPVPGRRNGSSGEGIGPFRCHPTIVRCCARGRAHSVRVCWQPFSQSDLFYG
jgi:hypothetical protein